MKKNISNQRFGRLVAVYPIDKTYQNKTIWHCVCDCGNEIDVVISYLTSGDTKSCGCLKQEIDQSNLRAKYDSKRVDGIATQLFSDKPRKDSSTGYRGVCKYYTRTSKQERYRAWITIKGKRYFKSGFLTAEDAYYNGRKELEKLYLPK
ncbi:hypothetical protein [Enterococcus sp. DIV0876]|uniref:hypothetical protein n=1 Tax=Enterococcus sp. DIV0876 TaxID=2774633 RepID=UPI003D2FE807